MKIKKLDTFGFSHHITLVAFVVIFAICGVGYMVASHANPTSSVSGAVSGKASPIVCAMGNVPAKAAEGQVIKPTVTFKNRSKKTVTFSAEVGVTIKGGKKGGGKGGIVTAGPLTVKAGKTTRVATGMQYTIVRASTSGQKANFQVFGSAKGASFRCTKATSLPY